MSEHQVEAKGDVEVKEQTGNIQQGAENLSVKGLLGDSWENRSVASCYNIPKSVGKPQSQSLNLAKKIVIFLPVQSEEPVVAGCQAPDSNILKLFLQSRHIKSLITKSNFPCSIMSGQGLVRAQPWAWHLPIGSERWAMCSHLAVIRVVKGWSWQSVFLVSTIEGHTLSGLQTAPCSDNTSLERIQLRGPRPAKKGRKTKTQRNSSHPV